MSEWRVLPIALDLDASFKAKMMKDLGLDTHELSSSAWCKSRDCHVCSLNECLILGWTGESCLSTCPLMQSSGHPDRRILDLCLGKAPVLLSFHFIC